MKLHELRPPAGSTHRPKIVGRGIGGKGGKTAGRGTKGQKARRQIRAGFEGGQLPLLARIPNLKGFTNPFRVAYTPVNLDQLAALELTSVGVAEFVEHGLARKGDLVKILGRGELTARVDVAAHGFSVAARAAIEAAGGTATEVPLPFAVRPPAAGNQHQNR
jgi:large subunit ribosomal protein L15